MKRILALLLILLISCMAAVAEDAVPDDGLPQVGEVVYGFEAKEVVSFPLLNSEVV